MKNELAQRLIKARSGHGWTQADLAEVSEVAAAQISRYEAGRSKPRPEVIAKLAKALAVRFEWLAYGEGEIELADGSEAPKHPSSRVSVIEIDMTPDLIDFVEEFAKARGITYEMAINVAMREALAMFKANPEELVASIKARKEKGDETP